MKLFFILVIISIINSCYTSEHERLGDDIGLFKNTPVWELAKAVESEDTIRIASLLKNDNKELNFQEPSFNKTLLEWSVYTGRYNSAKILFEFGANPFIKSHNGLSAFILSAQYFKTSKFLMLFLKNSLNINDLNIKNNLNEALIMAAGANIENTKGL